MGCDGLGYLRFVAFLDEEPKLGVCLTFPLEAARSAMIISTCTGVRVRAVRVSPRLVERRQRLCVVVTAVRDRDDSKAKPTKRRPLLDAGGQTHVFVVVVVVADSLK
eukprot:4193890-Amphidinium_carterae.1